MYHPNKTNREILEQIAIQAMLDYGLVPEYSPALLKELKSLIPEEQTGQERDMRSLLWCSIDNRGSRDLDQLSYAEELPDGKIRIYVAIADVTRYVKNRSELDSHARQNTSSVYTPAVIFSMLPPRLSEDLSSLGEGHDRHTIVFQGDVTSDGYVDSPDIYPALVHNHAKLCYEDVDDMLEARGDVPEPIARIKGLSENLSIQDEAASRLRSRRQKHGALTLETASVKPVFDGNDLLALEDIGRNRAKALIEDLMICANVLCAEFLEANGLPSLRRVVHKPARWERIVALAKEKGYQLPSEPDSPALEDFLISMKSRDPLRFQDLSLSIVKLLGPGEYVLDLPGQDSDGHFGLAVKDYTHSTAPNRRYPDLITQRMLKAVLYGTPQPYSTNELTELARRCNQGENAGRKVERRVDKSAAAMLLEKKVGQSFEGIVTGASAKGSWVRLIHPPCEGRLVEGYHGLDVGELIKVRLMGTDIYNGYLDFAVVK